MHFTKLCVNTIIRKDEYIVKKRLSAHLMSEWHLIKNAPLTAEQVSAGSGKAVWWQCSECNHEWKAIIHGRSRGNGCPMCAGKVVTTDNNLAVTNPKLAQEWHPTKNGSLLPQNFMPKSNKVVWWKCSKCEHEWEALISNRSRGNGCPACSGRIASEHNNLAVTHPDIAKEWHHLKNGNFTPVKATKGSHKHAWWLCSHCNHEWKSPIYYRTIGRGCPNCAKSKMKKSSKK